MPLPEGMSEFEHLQSVYRQVMNAEMRDEFKDLGENWEPEITSPRGNLRWACTHKDEDSALMTMMRTDLLFLILRRARDYHPPIFGSYVHDIQESREYKPKLQLYFQEDYNDIEPGYPPLTGEINIRLMNQTTETLTLSECNSYANAVRSHFANSGGFIWRKGKVMVTYSDAPRGYKLQLLCRTADEGERVIRQVLEIQSHPFLNEKMNIHQAAAPSEAYPTNPGTITVLGKSKKRPRKRPMGDVRFQSAYLDIWARPEPLVLVDRSGIHRKTALIFAA